MHPIAINKEIFEFTCSQEEVAKKVRQEFINYIAPQIHDLIFKVITEQLSPQNSVRIDNMEVDLGDVGWSEFGQAEMLQKFEQDFTRQISRFKNQPVGKLSIPNLVTAKSPGQLELGATTKQQTPVSAKLTPLSSADLSNPTDSGYNGAVSTLTDDWELVQSFLTKGNLPWWAEQIKPAEIDKAIRRLIIHRPQAFQNFLREQQPDSGVWQRLTTHVKPTTQTLLQQLLSEQTGLVPTPIFNNRRLHKAGFTIPVLTFTKEQIVKLKAFLQRIPFVSSDSQKARLLRQIMQLKSLNWMQQAALFDWLPETEFKTVQEYFTPENSIENLTDKFRVEAALQVLTLWQMEFLLHPSAAADLSLTYEPKEVLNPPSTTNHVSSDSFPGPEMPTDNSSLVTKKPILPTPEEDKPDTYALLTGKLKLTSSNLNSLVADNAISSPAKNLELFPGIKSSGLALETKETEFYNQANNPIPEKLKAVPAWKTTFKKTVKNKRNGQHHLINLQPDIKNWNNFRPIQENAAFRGKIVRKEIKTIAVEKENGFNWRVKDFYLEGVNNPLLELQPTAPNPQVISILQNLSLSNQAISNWLHQLPLRELQRIQAIFTKPIGHSRERSKLVHYLVSHPYLLQYSLLSLLASIPDVFALVADFTDRSTVDFNANFAVFDEEKPGLPEAEAPVLEFNRHLRETNPESKLKAIHTQLIQVINNLSRKEGVIIQNILSKAVWHTQSEKSSLQRFMAKLPTESLLFLRALIDLPEAELQQLTNQTRTLPHLWPESKWQEQQIESSEETAAKIYVENAGLCLLAPYLTSIFSRLNYLEKQQFKNSYVAARALQATQYLVTGKRQNPEYLLALNKLLCGIKSDVALAGGIRLTKKEILEADSLLKSLIEHWQALKSTSPQGFRESFLQRKGILTESDARWTLQVERKSHDLLLNTIPWGFNLIKLPWMNKMLQVEW